MATKRSRAGRRPAKRQPVVIERYTPQRIAEFLLNNAVDGPDYARAVKAIRRMGLRPEDVEHVKPIGVR